MGRRTSKAAQLGVGAPGYDTVGLNILPGHPLPVWAGGDEPEPVQAAVTSDPVDQSWAPPGDAGWPTDGAAAPDAAAPAVDSSPEAFGGWPAEANLAATAAAGSVPATAGAAMAPAPATAAVPAMAGAPAAEMFPAAAMAGAFVGASTYGASDGAPYGTFAAPSTQLGGVPAGAPFAPASSAALGTMPGSAAGTVSPAFGTVHPSAPPAFPGPAVPGDAHVPGPVNAAAAPVQAPVDPAAPVGAFAGAPTDAESPSEVGNVGERTELSPEHVALLTWWADMISKGQFPGSLPDMAAGPGAVAEPAGATPAKGSGRVLKTVALGVVAVVIVGAGLLLGPRVMDMVSAEPAPVGGNTATLALPGSVDDLVPLEASAAQDALPAVIGLGLRQAGATVTQAYGTAADGPLALAALATTAPAAADATGQAMAWAEQTGATLGDEVTGTGETASITCSPVTEIEGASTGSVCFWLDPNSRGQTYVVGAAPEAAIERTAALRSDLARITTS